MKKFGVGFLLAMVAVGICACLGAVTGYKDKPSLPDYDGRLKVTGLTGEVNVYRDQYGIPHIFSENQHDLFFAVGYTQAQDRLFEMVLLRAVAEGRMSELLGDLSVPGPSFMGFKLSTVAIDRRQRTMGLKWIGVAGEAILKQYNPEIFNQLQDYSDGVNAFIAAHPNFADLPVEFQLLRVKPEPFRVADVASQGAFIASLLCGNMDVELLRYLVAKKYGMDRMWELMPLHDGPGPTIVPPELLKNKLPIARDLPPGGRPSAAELGLPPNVSTEAIRSLYLAETAIKTFLYAEYPLASNDWVVSGKLTENGHAMLANDPHLTNIEPSLFYLMHVKGAGFDAYGVTFPGNPYVVLGHARKLSWGCTTSIADVQDLFIETTDKDHPGQYKYKGEWRPFTFREEIIRVRVGNGFQERKFMVRHSIHGPIINDMMGLKKDEPPLALRWTGWDFDRNLQAFEAMASAKDPDDLIARIEKIPAAGRRVMNIAIMYNHFMKGTSLDDFLKGIDQIVAPDQSWVAADADGRIAYLPGGFVPIRNKGVGVMPVPGESGDFDWTGFVPTAELPQSIDPERGYMATANNEVVDAEWYPYVFATNYGAGWRAWRIEELIVKYAPLSMDDMKAIQNDVYVKQAEWHLTFIERAMNNKKPADPLAQRALAELQAWDFQADLDATAPALFFTYLKTLRKNVLSDEVSAQDYKELLSSGEMEMLVEIWLKNGANNPGFDDRRTKAVEDADDMIVKSLGEAMAAVDKLYGPDPKNRAWGKIHTIKWTHPFGFGPLKELSVGPFPHLGANGTVRNASGSPGKDGIYRTHGGPVLRHIMDMGAPDAGQIVIDGSVSGQWLSPHYSDLHQLFLHSQYVTAVMDPALVAKEAKYHLVLTP